MGEISPHHRLSQVKGINSVVRQGNLRDLATKTGLMHAGQLVLLN